MGHKESTCLNTYPKLHLCLAVTLFLDALQDKLTGNVNIWGVSLNYVFSQNKSE